MDSWKLPTSKTKQDALALDYARDGFALLGALYAPGQPMWLRELPAVQVLRTVLLQNYTRITSRGGREVIKRRERPTRAVPRRNLAAPGARAAGTAREQRPADRCAHGPGHVGQHVKASSATARKGGTFSLSGHLLTADKAVLTKQTIKVYFQAKGSTEWVYSGSAMTDSKTAFKRTLTVKASGSWRARYAGTSAYLGSTTVSVSAS